MKTTQAVQRRAFTLVELLVVITIIALLISLLLPAVQSAREAARQSQCQNNMKQLGLAAMNYESQNWFFPPSSYYVIGTDPAKLRTHYRNWVIALLPFLEQQAVYDAFDFSVPINHSSNRAARGTDLTVVKCPTDMGHRVMFASVDSSEGDNWARGNYAANASLAVFGPNTGPGYDGTKTPYSTSRWHRGIMGANLSMGVSEIYDGSSNTILLAEVRVGLVKEDRRGTWAMGVPGASTLWQHGWNEINRPNYCANGSDDIMDCPAIQTSAGGLRALQVQCMQCYDSSGTYNFNGQGGSRSQHPGGVYATMADGSVRFLSNYIETTAVSNWNASLNTLGNDPARLLCWQRLCLSQDGQVIDGKKF